MRRVRHLKLLTASITATTLIHGVMHGLLSIPFAVVSLETLAPKPLLAQNKPKPISKPSRPKSGQSSGNLSTTTIRTSESSLTNLDPFASELTQTQGSALDSSSFGPASLEDEEDAQGRYGIWGGVLP